MHYPPPPPSFGGAPLAEGINMIRRSEPDFDPDYFKEVAQDVFFQVQAGWMQRDISAYRHLLGKRLAQEYIDAEDPPFHSHRTAKFTVDIVKSSYYYF
ncbi:MAG: TIM44-like domain-containing protein [Desulfobulbaceae bacterium]|nr:TIM44-like domain-containing protein [Desulfobulbaceae bacterium]